MIHSQPVSITQTQKLVCRLKAMLDLQHLHKSSGTRFDRTDSLFVTSYTKRFQQSTSAKCPTSTLKTVAKMEETNAYYEQLWKAAVANNNYISSQIRWAIRAGMDLRYA